MKRLYAAMLTVALVVMFYSDVEKKGSFDITEGTNPETPTMSLQKKGSFDLTVTTGKDPEEPVVTG